MPPPFHTDYGQVTAKRCRFEPSLFVNHTCKFAHGKPVQQRNAVHPDKGRTILFQYGTRHMVARIRTIQHNERYACFGGCLHYVVQRADVGVKACSHVLQIKEQYIDVCQIFPARLAMFSVERYHRKPRWSIFSVGNACSGVISSAISVFGRIEFYHVLT